ncbi:hypothetical protein NW766_006239 [Fusarium irregulare]|uniref:Uncharacterized protein n=1 Tax=Fusarium irregulare TaxID=2494466 RepID=A0A9W8U8W4_9HYPO|nr:hypothetical protein NW766_006239 [Fusarium irregulare]
MFHWNVEVDEDEFLQFKRPLPLPMCKPISSRLGRVEADLSIVKREREEEEEVSPSVEIRKAPAPAPTPAPAAANPEQRVAAAQATVDKKQKLLQAMAEMPESEPEKSSSLSPSYNLWDTKLAPTTTTVS